MNLFDINENFHIYQHRRRAANKRTNSFITSVIVVATAGGVSEAPPSRRSNRQIEIELFLSNINN